MYTKQNIGNSKSFSHVVYAKLVMFSQIDASTSASEIHSLTQSLLSSAPLLTKDRQCREDMLHKLCDLSGTGDGLSLEEQFMKIHLEHVLRI